MSDATADGSFEVYYHDGWVHLVVNAPSAGGRPVYRDDVQNRLRLLGAPRAAAAEIATLIDHADGLPHRLVEWPDGRKLASVITVHVPEDEMSAILTVTEPKRGALPPTVQELMRALSSCGVKRGIDEDSVRAIVRDQLYNQESVVASGTPAQHARPGEIRYHFNPHRGKPYLQMDYGRINLKELNFIESKAAGSLLAELLPAAPAIDGETVTGHKVPARREVDIVELVAGENTEVTDSGRTIHATADGNVRLVDGAIVVEPLVVVENVDYSTGNIHFEGAVVVEKSIADGFVVEAGGDVQVNRGVGRAQITAGGNVLLKAGVNGGGEGRITCDGNFVAKYLEGSEVTCRKNAFVEEAIMHSHVSVTENCVLTGRRAEIISSTVIAGASLWCKKLGSIAGGETTVHIGVAPHLLTSYRETRAELEKATTEEENAREKVRQIDRSLAEGNTDPRLGPAKKQLSAELVELTAAVKQLKNDARQLRDRLEASRSSMLVVEDTIYPGSAVFFGRLEFRPPGQGSSATVLRARPGKIEEHGYNPAERPVIEFENADVQKPEAPELGTEKPGLGESV